MKVSCLKLLFTAFLFFSLSLPLSLLAQEEEPEDLYVLVMSFNLKPGFDLNEVQGEVWLPIHQELIKNGHQTGFDLFSVQLPNKPGWEYDYVTVNHFNSMEQLNAFPGAVPDAAEAVHAGKTWDEIEEMTVDSRDAFHREVFILRNAAAGETGTELGDIFAVNYMKVKPGQNQAYLEMENELAKPIHQLSIEAGTLKSWGVWEKIIPWGSEQAHDFATIEQYSNLGDREKIDMLAGLQEAHPGFTAEEAMERVESTRTLVGGEIWYRMFRLRPETEN